MSINYTIHMDNYGRTRKAGNAWVAGHVPASAAIDYLRTLVREIHDFFVASGGSDDSLTITHTMLQVGAPPTS
jgi:hypothetical protein